MKPVLRKELFWGVDFKSIDYEKNATPKIFPMRQ